MDWILFGLTCGALGWGLGWTMGIQRTVVIYKGLRDEADHHERQHGEQNG